MLKGKIAVVTGASRGIGKAIALELAKEGATVLVNYHGNKEKAEEVVREIEKQGGMGESISWDVSDFLQCEEAFKRILEKYERIDILVNNAGITKDGLLMKMTEEDFDQVINVNLKGCFHCMRMVTRQMMKWKM